MTSTQRALAVLDCFSPKHPVLTLSEVARSLVSRSHPLIATGELTRWALERDERGRYSGWTASVGVGSLAPRSNDLRHVALPFMETSMSDTSDVQVAVLDGGDVIYVERLFSHHAHRSSHDLVCGCRPT